MAGLLSQPAALERRARLHGALADAHRLAIVEALLLSDRSPGQLGRLLRLPSNLLAHHLAVLEREGLVERRRSDGDGRRRYLRLRREPLRMIAPTAHVARPRSVLFVCTLNSARSQLAEALWRERSAVRAESAGTRPATRVHPAAVRAAQRRGLDLSGARPRPLAGLEGIELVVTVCDEADETLRTPAATTRLHWSLPDPVPLGTARAFNDTVDALLLRIAPLREALDAGSGA